MKLKKNNKNKILFIIIAILIIYILWLVIYSVDRKVNSSAMLLAEAQFKQEATEIMQNNVYEVYTQGTQSQDFLKIEKDSEGNITLLRADTVRMTALAQKVALKCTKDIENLGKNGVKVPWGYVTNNNLLSRFGPKITACMEPIGRVQIKYSSEFEAAGINQTRHKIKITLSARIKVILPTENREVLVENDMPVSETIIVGKIPNTNLSLGN
ncbi:sporulation protein YunB [Inconstantimicrobium mannanitabidum]|uniref:Sporulation protein YunB n=1 Tax=Inconstantimicrobium mannanitabidum TaxID=1604901 RepID=A0ACB5R9Y7_9CLOT|nr:sporulation protein YunB [Clostridium sp. TW13]GKX66000.1 sporulation protein YunB [Clostridium sp. TW13]